LKEEIFEASKTNSFSEADTPIEENIYKKLDLLVN
jgi:hypothetical protein